MAIFIKSLLNVSANKNIFVFLEKLSSNRIIVNNNTPLLLTGVNLRWFFITTATTLLLLLSPVILEEHIEGESNNYITQLRSSNYNEYQLCINACFLLWLVFATTTTLWHYKTTWMFIFDILPWSILCMNFCITKTKNS